MRCARASVENASVTVGNLVPFFEINKTDFPADQTESVSHSASHSSFSKVVQMSKKGAKSSNKEVLLSYGTRDIVLGKVRGYPPWPGMVRVALVFRFC